MCTLLHSLAGNASDRYKNEPDFTVGWMWVESGLNVYCCGLFWSMRILYHIMFILKGGAIDRYALHSTIIPMDKQNNLLSLEYKIVPPCCTFVDGLLVPYSLVFGINMAFMWQMILYFTYLFLVPTRPDLLYRPDQTSCTDQTRPLVPTRPDLLW